MPTVAPVPAATMRSGSTALAPFVVTRTGRMSWTPLPGSSFSARKLNFSVDVLVDDRLHVGGTSKPFVASQSSSAFGVGRLELHGLVRADDLLLRGR